VNYSQVRSRGVESTIRYNRFIGNTIISLKAGYAFTKSTLESSADGSGSPGNQLRYVPEHSFNGNIRIQYNRLYFSFTNQLTGSRYTSSDNDPAEKLNSHNINNLLFGIQIGKKNHLTIQTKITNLFDVEYQVIRSYPMPGRGFYLTMVLNIEK
jgi:outer membrane cobalamin receptor